MNSRAIAATTLSRVISKKTPLDQALVSTFSSLANDKDKGFIQELCYGVSRWYFRLELIASHLLDKPLKQKDSDITMLILLGIYQLDFMRTPAHAAVSSSVDACTALKKPWAKKLVNAVLRRYQREHAELQSKIQQNESALYSHPEWMIDKLKESWPEDWQDLLEQANQNPPFHLRVNLGKNTRKRYLEKLADHQLQIMELPLAKSAISVSPAIAVEKLPGFTEGEVSVQDQGAQLAAFLLDLAPGMRVLDACAAPGGKSAHILEYAPQLQELVAIDTGKKRTALLEATRERLQNGMHIVQADARDTQGWWDGQNFDRILLDAPCSASGVIRRHPDIKLLRDARQVRTLLKLQEELLCALWPLLKDGGKMLYCSCSLFREENDEQIARHLERFKNAELVMIDAGWGKATTYGRQSLSSCDETDNFYYSLLKKTDTN